ncbi:MAG: DNA-protecting protein DprA [Elusimicrobia bacterium]|nr:DNA-protecting protein DprA [Elusimicrobiota bacterium]
MNSGLRRSGEDVLLSPRAGGHAGLSVGAGEAGYPQLLGSIPDPPRTLHYLGVLDPGARGIAFVGSRAPTAYGRRMARSLAGDAARSGFVVVSGLARGLDTEAHQAALAAGGLTWAVLGCGLDRVYPPENKRLAERIVESGGCVLSEFEPGTPPLPEHFPRRNRVIAGLCWATVVVEGRVKSGSLITARLAASQGREVLAVPGPADSELSAAPHLLLREGAKPAGRLQDIVDELPPECRVFAASKGTQAPGPVLSAEKARLLDLIGHAGTTLEELVMGAGLDFSLVSHIIFQLELEGLVEPLEGQRYARI